MHERTGVGHAVGPRRRRHRTAGALVALAALAAVTACGADDGPTEGATGPDVPQRIVSLSPTHTEVLFAIGAGPQVIAVDAFSNYPDEAADRVTELSGFEPNVEAIAGYEPDLVVTEGTDPTLIEQLDGLGIANWSGPAVADFDDLYAQIEELGAVTGQESGAAALVESMRAEIAEIDAEVGADTDLGLTYYHELDPTYFSVTSDTFIGYVYGRLGLTSIADAADGAGGGYPQLNAEFILDADPDLIFVACTKYCGETAESVGARPGWDALSAVSGGRVIEMDDDIASRWGPRIVDYYRDVAAALAGLSTAVGS